MAPRASKKTRPAAPRRRVRAAGPGRTARRPPARKRRPRAEQPLGAGVADAFAVKRLQMPPHLTRARPDVGVREVSWTEFGELARVLAGRISEEFGPEVIVGVANGGVFLGGALAVPLHAEFHAVHVDRKSKMASELGDLRGKRVLAVDDVTVSGRALAAVRAAAKRAGAREVRTAALVMRPDGSRPDFHAIETSDVVVFGWDYQLTGGGPAGPGDPGEIGV